MHIYKHNKPFNLERGGTLPGIEIAYHTFGKLNSRKDNVIWVCHALTANSDVADWWPGTVVEGGFLDPKKWFVVCANILGSCYGSTGPLSIDPSSGEPYYEAFPAITLRDIVSAHIILADYLKLERIEALIGSSVGGFQALEWAVMQPERFNKLVLIATDSHVTPWCAALDETQRMAILADGTYGDHTPDAGKAGLAAARAIGLLSYRGGSGYNASQKNSVDQPLFTHRAHSYQRYQGEKLCKRFNVYSYMNILDSFDTHDISRGRGSLKDVLGLIRAKTACIGITTDIVFPPEGMKKLNDDIPDSEYFEINSEFGHDGFLVEHKQLNDILIKFLER